MDRSSIRSLAILLACIIGLGIVIRIGAGHLSDSGNMALILIFGAVAMEKFLLMLGELIAKEQEKRKINKTKQQPPNENQ